MLALFGAINGNSGDEDGNSGDEDGNSGDEDGDGGDSAVSTALDSALWFCVLAGSSLLLSVPLLIYLVAAPLLLPRVEDVVYSFD